MLTICALSAIDQNVIGARAVEGGGTVLWRPHNEALQHWQPVTMCKRPLGRSLLSAQAAVLNTSNSGNSNRFIEARLATLRRVGREHIVVRSAIDPAAIRLGGCHQFARSELRGSHVGHQRTVPEHRS